MNDFVTVYELLGLIKDGKAPKKIKWEDYIFSFYNDDYLCENEDFSKNHETSYLLCYLFSLPGNALNIKVEILEDKKEELELLSWQQIGYLDRALEEIVKDINTQNKKTNGKINEIIRYLKNKEDKNN